MSAASSTKIFGVRVGLDPKLLIGALVVIAGALYWYNSRADEGGEAGSSARSNRSTQATQPTSTIPRRSAAARRSNSGQSDRGTLRLRPIDATHGDIDPTLHLDLLARLKAVGEGKIGRSVFESGPSPLLAPNGTPIKSPKVPVTPVLPPSAPPRPPAPTVNVPLKYYGYVKPEEKSEANRGLFLDGDNILVAIEGQTVKGHYLVVELTPNSARMEDTELHMGQTLPVVPQAMQQ